MKKFLLVLLTFISMTVVAQSKFGYVSYMEIVKALPEYSIVEAHLDELQAKYEAEIERADREFNQKYADFIEEQSQLQRDMSFIQEQGTARADGKIDAVQG